MKIKIEMFVKWEKIMRIEIKCQKAVVVDLSQQCFILSRVMELKIKDLRNESHMK